MERSSVARFILCDVACHEPLDHQQREEPHPMKQDDVNDVRCKNVAASCVEKASPHIS